MKIQHFAPNSNIKDILAAMHKDGCVVIDNVLTTEQHTKVKSDLDSHLSKIDNCQGDFYGYSTKRLGLLLNKSEVFQDMALNETVLKVMDEFLWNTHQYQINLTQAISIGSEEPRQIMHQDDPMFHMSHDGYELMVNCMWAIDDFTIDNGATVLVPGSHKWDRNRVLDLDENQFSPDQIVAGEMKKGSVLIYLGSLFHCGGYNRTSAYRCGAIISYCLGQLRQAENAYLGYPYEDVMKMPAKLQELVGYFVHKPNLGSVNGMHPKEFMEKSGRQEFKEFLPDEIVPLLKEHREKFVKSKAA